MQPLCDGIVLYRNILSLGEQLKFIKIIQDLKLDELNYPDKRGNPKGRSYNKITDFPDDFNNKINEIKQIIEAEYDQFKYNDFTHILTMYYPSEIGMGWHRDDYNKVDGKSAHDGDKDAPIYSLSLGNTAIFQYTPCGTKQVINITLNSGDLLVFGGVQRHMWHCLKQVNMGTFSEEFNARINITLRSCPNLSEEQYEMAQTKYLLEGRK
jgi:alkylated DNA repair dioxygenase AlkB